MKAISKIYFIVIFLMLTCSNANSSTSINDDLDIKLYTKVEYQKNMKSWNKSKKTHLFVNTGLYIIKKPVKSQKCNALQNIRYYAKWVTKINGIPGDFIALYITIKCPKFEETSLLLYKVTKKTISTYSKLFVLNVSRDHMLFRFVESFLSYYSDKLVYHMNEVREFFLSKFTVLNISSIYRYIELHKNNIVLRSQIRNYNNSTVGYIGKESSEFRTAYLKKNLLVNQYYINSKFKKRKISKSIKVFKFNETIMFSKYSNYLIFTMSISAVVVMKGIDIALRDNYSLVKDYFLSDKIRHHIEDLTSKVLLQPTNLEKRIKLVKKTKTVYKDYSKIAKDRESKISRTKTMEFLAGLILVILMIAFIFWCYLKVHSIGEKEYLRKQHREHIAKEVRAFISFIELLQSHFMKYPEIELSNRQKNIWEKSLLLNSKGYIDLKNLILANIDDDLKSWIKKTFPKNHNKMTFQDLNIEVLKLEVYIECEILAIDNRQSKGNCVVGNKSQSITSTRSTQTKDNEKLQVVELKLNIDELLINKGYKKNILKYIKLIEESYRRPSKVIPQLEFLLLVVDGLKTLKSYTDFLNQISMPYNLLKQKNKIKEFEKSISKLKSELSKQKLIP